MKYYYFHGYGSSPKALKADAMREILGESNVTAPDFNVSAEEVSELFDKLIDEIKPAAEEVCIVGSSLGGLYALYISAKTNCNVILLNPALMPMVVVPKVTNNVPVTDVITAQKLSLYAYENYNSSKVSVWVTNDQLINHEALTKPYFYKGLKEYKEFINAEASGHEFTGFKDVFKKYIKSGN